MNYYQLDNGLKIIYKKSQSKLTSISIGLDAGATSEKNFLGVAHATEHMVFKGTKTRNEIDINKVFNKNFAFYNAMTNYSYVIYYGSLLEEDFEKGIDIFSDILINPTFLEEGFKEEMNVIFEELREWDKDIEQYCEDRLFYNAFSNYRLKYPIIGTMKDLKKITLDYLKEFYKEKYLPSNTSIAVVSSLDFHEIKRIIVKYFGEWVSEELNTSSPLAEMPTKGEFIEEKDGIKISRVEIIFSIKDITPIELKALKIFDAIFAVGTDSILFHKLRTKNGLVYDINSEIVYDKGIKLYKIMFNISEENLIKAKEIVRESIENISNDFNNLNHEKIKELSKGIKLRKLFKEEQSIQMAKEMSTYSLMFNDHKIYEDSLENIENITLKEILNIGNNILKNPAIQIINPRRSYE